MRGGLVDLVFFEFVVKGTAADSQTLGCLLLVPATLVEDFLQKSLLVIYQCGRLADICSGGGSMEYSGEFRGLDAATFGQDCGMFDCVFQFTHIARPRIIQ